MARARFKHVVTDRAGNVVQNAKVFCYETGTTTLLTDLYTAESGGSAVAASTLVSNAQGEIEGFLNRPRRIDLKVTDNTDTAYYPSAPSQALSFSDFTERVDSEFRPTFQDLDVTWYGAVGDGSTDDAPAFYAAIADAQTNGGRILLPPPPVAYKLNSTVTVPNAKLAFIGQAVEHNNLQSQFLVPPHVAVRSGVNPGFLIKDVTAGVSFTNIDFTQGHTPISIRNSAAIVFDHCGFQSYNAGEPAVLIQNSFWVWFNNRCTFGAPDTSTPAVDLIGTAGVDSIASVCYLIKFEDSIFNNNGVRYTQTNAAGGPVAFGFTFINPQMENLNNGYMFYFKGQGNVDADRIFMLMPEMFDSTGTCPFMRIDNAGKALNAVIVNPGQPTGNRTVQVDAGAPRIQIIGPNNFATNVVNASDQAVGETIQQRLSGIDVISNTGSAPSATTTNTAGAPIRVGRQAETSMRYALDRDGKQYWGPGTGAFDTNLYRSAADTLKTDDSFTVGTNLTVTGSSTTAAVTSSATIRAEKFGGNTLNQFLVAPDGGSATWDFEATQTFIGDGHNLALGSTTGNKIGTAGTQKLSFYGVTPVAQPANTADIISGVLDTLGLRASGGNPNLTIGTGTLKGGLLGVGTNSAPAAGTDVHVSKAANVGIRLSFEGAENWDVKTTTVTASGDTLTFAATTAGNMLRLQDGATPKIGFFATAPAARQTYGAPTGTATRTTFDTTSVTLAVLAEHVKALIDDLRSYGLCA